MNLLPAAAFVKFERDLSLSQKQDWYETGADAGLAVLRTALGYKSVHVLKDREGRLEFKESDYCLPGYIRVAAIVVAVLFAPVALVGCFLVKRSISHRKMSRNFRDRAFRTREIKQELIRPKRLLAKVKIKSNNDNKLYGLDLIDQKIPDGNKFRELHEKGEFFALKEKMQAASKPSKKQDIQKFPINGTATLAKKILSPSTVVLAKQKILRIIEAVKLFDEQIVSLTNRKCSLIQNESIPPVKKGNYRFFQFDLAASQNIHDNLENLANTDKVDQVVQKIYLDAVESLAEYNIASELVQQDLTDDELKQFRDQFYSDFFWHKCYLRALDYSVPKPNLVCEPNNRFIDKLISSGTKAPAIMQEILDKAKQTMKGQTFITGTSGFFHESGFVQAGPVTNLSISNPESENWWEPWHQRFALIGDFVGGTDLLSHHLVGKNEGDRVCVTQGGDQIILRCVQRSDKSNDQGDFQEVFVRNIFKDKTDHFNSLSQQHQFLVPLVKYNFRATKEGVKEFYGEKIMHFFPETREGVKKLYGEETMHYLSENLG